RPVSIRASSPGRLFDIGPAECALTCTFAVPAAPDAGGQAVQEGTCILPKGEAVSFRVNDEQGSHAHGVGLFAGLRLDCFFMDVRREVDTRATRRLAFQASGTNYLDGVNVLSIVVELDVATVLGPAPGTLLAVAAETVTAGPLPMRLERLGRPELKNI